MSETTEMSELQELLAEFGDDVVHIKGNLYEIKESLIEIPEPFDPNAKKLKVGNPRWTTGSDGKTIAKGLFGSKKDSEEAESLRNAIRDHGMDHPIKVRIEKGKTTKLVCINGDRRLRARSKLRKDKTKCYNAATGKKESAEKVLEFVECRVGIWSEEEAIEQAITGNDTSVPIGVAATVHVVRSLKKHYEDVAMKDDSLTNEKQRSTFVGRQIRLRMGSKSETWLREEYELLKLDDKTFQALRNETIDRKVAISLASISDVADRLERLDLVCDALHEHIAAKKEKLQADIEKLEDKRILAAIQVDDDKLDGLDPSESEEQVAEIESKVNSKNEDLVDLEESPPSATSRQLDQANQKVSKSKGGDVKVKPFTYSKINRCWKKQCEKLIKEENEEIDLEDARLVNLIIDTMGKAKTKQDGKTPINIENILKQHDRARTKRLG
jgi:hypothetical protein